MWQSIRTFLFGPSSPPGPAPTPIAIRAIRFPADGSPPHTLSLTTTTDGVADGPASPWGHIPDVRRFWKTSRAWKWHDIDTFRLENQSIEKCNGLYAVFCSFDLEALPNHHYFPEAIYGRQRGFAGDVFVAKLRGAEIGQDLGEDGWAAWVDVPEEVLTLPVMKVWGEEPIPASVVMKTKHNHEDGPMLLRLDHGK